MAEFTTYGPNADAQGLRLAGATLWDTGGAAAYGSRPTAPAPQITAGANTGAAIGAQQSVYNQLPGYNASLGNIGENIQSETAGELPELVKRQLAQAAAERGIATGVAGSPNSTASYLQSVGLESLDLTGLGQKNFQSLLPELPGNAIAQNPLSYVTPGLQYESGLQNSIFQSAPDPAAAAHAGMNAVASGFAAGRGSGGGLSLPGFNSSAATDWWNQPSPGTVTGNSAGGGTYIGGVYYGPGQQPGNSDLLGGILQSYAPTVYGQAEPAPNDLLGSAIDSSQPAQLALGGFDSGAGAISGGDNLSNYFAPEYGGY